MVVVGPLASALLANNNNISGVKQIQFNDFENDSTITIKSGVDISTDIDVLLPSGNGTLALTSQIPTNTNQLTNGAGYLTQSTELDAPLVTGLSGTTPQARILIHDAGKTNNIFLLAPQLSSSTVNITLPNAPGTLALVSQIPTNTNALTNGAGFITQSTTNFTTQNLSVSGINTASLGVSNVGIGNTTTGATNVVLNNADLLFVNAGDVGTSSYPAGDFVGEDVYHQFGQYSSSGTAIFSHPQNAYNPSTNTTTFGFNMRTYVYAAGSLAGSMLFDNMSWGFSGSTGGSWIGTGKIVPRTSSSYVPMNFTGQHRCCSQDPDIIANVDSYVGMVVISTGVFDSIVPDPIGSTSPLQDHFVNGVNVKKEVDQIHEPEMSTDQVSINEAQPIVALSTTKNDKRVYGVISTCEEGDERTFTVGSYSTSVNGKIVKRRLFINSLGEGGILVCNQHGDIENGDLLCSSDVTGIAMKQDDDLFRSCTIAKATQDYTFQNDTDYPLIGCTYHCG